MWLAITAIIIGLAILVWSADQFIEGATDLAIRYKLPNFLIGVLILGVGTSAPELVVSALSAFAGSPGIALGNAYGSDIINITLVLGATAVISPIAIHRSVLREDFMFLAVITVLAAWQLRDGTLSFVDGIVLITALVAVLALQTYLALRQKLPRQKAPPTALPLNAELTANNEINTVRAVLTLLMGLSLLIASSRAIVWGAVDLARLWGMSELMIGLTIIAIGTSLPELVASVTAARQGKHDMALGNVVGSNLFNTLGVVGLAAVIEPMKVEPQILSRDMVMVGISTILLIGLSILAYYKQSHIGKKSGLTLIAAFLGYSIWLAMSTN